MIKLKCVYEELGMLKTFTEINIETYDIDIIATYKKGIMISDEEVNSLTKKTKENKGFVEKICEFVRDYIAQLDGTKLLHPKTVFVISSKK